jgi:hypothetical protein
MKPKDIILKSYLISLIFLLDNGGYAQSRQIDIRPKIQNIVIKLQNESTLHLGSPVGFSGIAETNNKYYKLYKKLEANSTDKELIFLTKNQHKTIVLYSFLILQTRNYPQLKDIFLTHVNDTADVWIAGGCTGTIDKVNSFMLRQLNPGLVDKEGPYLTKSDYDHYLTLTSKND